MHNSHIHSYQWISFLNLLFLWWLVYVISSFRLSWRTDAKWKDENTSCEKTKRRKKRQAKRRDNAVRKDETRHAKRRNFSTKRWKKKNAMRKDAIWNFNFVVFSGGVFSFFRMASFRLFIWHYSSFRHEKAEWLKPATIVFIILSKTQNKLKVLFCIIYVLFFAEVFLLWLLLLFFYLILSWVVWFVLFYF